MAGEAEEARGKQNSRYDYGVTTHPSRRRALGIGLVVLGLAAILGSVLYVLEVANGPGTGPKVFAQRRSYDQVKAAVHRSFPRAFGAGLLGLGLAMLGSRIAKRPSGE